MRSQTTAISGSLGTYTVSSLDGTPLTDHAPVLTPGHVVTTAANSSVLIQIDSGSGLLLREKSRIYVKSADQKNVHIYLMEGSVLATVSHRRADQNFFVETSDALCSVVGTVFSVTRTITDSDSSTTLAVHEGRVAFADPLHASVATLVSAGTCATLAEHALKPTRTVTAAEVPAHDIALINQLWKSGESNPSVLDIAARGTSTRIYVDDRTVGIAPCVVQTTPGTHRIRFESAGSSFDTTITANPRNATFVMSPTKASAPAVAFATPKKQTISAVEPSFDIARIAGDYLPPDPSHIEALIQISAGEYQKALRILDSVSKLPTVPFSEKMAIATSMTECYRAIGSYDTRLKAIDSALAHSQGRDRENLLWQAANIRANCLADYTGAAANLREIETLPESAWKIDARFKLSEILYITGNFSEAATLLKNLSTDHSLDTPHRTEALYRLANVYRCGLKEYSRALNAYNTLLSDTGIHISNCWFERAECRMNLGNKREAMADYEKYISMRKAALAGR